MGQFVFDDPSVPIEEKFEGWRILCIRGQIEENLPITHRASLGPRIFRIGVAIACTPTVPRPQMYNTQID